MQEVDLEIVSMEDCGGLDEGKLCTKTGIKQQTCGVSFTNVLYFFLSESIAFFTGRQWWTFVGFYR